MLIAAVVSAAHLDDLDESLLLAGLLALRDLDQTVDELNWLK
jgi:hypothetical protein